MSTIPRLQPSDGLNNRTSNGKERGQVNGNWDYIGGYIGVVLG